jgi:hypothetical protein
MAGVLDVRLIDPVRHFIEWFYQPLTAVHAGA